MKASHSRFAQLAIASACVLLTSAAFAQQGESVPARVTEAVDPQNLVVLRGNTHPLARPESDRGAAPDSQAIRRVLLVLQRSPEQETALRRLLNEQQTKGSPNFHHWLTPQEFGMRFGPTDADIQAVTDWLTSEGFLVSRVGAGRTVLEFSGTAGQVRQAFHTEIHRFALNGEERFANTSDPQIPAALAPVVKGFASLNSFPRTPMIRRLGTFQRSKTTGEVRPLFTFTIGAGTAFAVGPSDFAKIYNVQPLWDAGTDGTGVTIAIVGESDINLQDVQDFRTMWGLPANDPNFILDGPDPGVVPGDETESDLDVEWAGAVAKGATIDFVVSESTESSAGIDLSAFDIIDNNMAAVMSESYGSCELFLGTGGNTFYSNLWEQASAQGITVLVSSGDQGSAVCDAGSIAAQFGPMVSGNASTPFNVAVGGTDFNDNGAWATYWNSTNTASTNASAKSYIPETTWNDTCANNGSLTNCSSAAGDGRDMVGGSGGPSNCANSTIIGSSYTCNAGYTKPSWQTGTGVPTDGVRDLPDVSLFAADGLNGSFYVICEMDANAAQGGSATSCDLNSPFTNFLGVGGTSASSPAFAGIMAMVNQKTGERQGNANYVLYKLAAQSGASCTSNASAVSNSSCIFYDVNNAVTTGNSNISVACYAGTPNCSNQTLSGFGVLVTNLNGSGTTLAWTTTAGYDLATGLGTVNAKNLVNNWTSASFKASTTTISSLFPTTIAHGQPINFTVGVAATPPASGTPTGDISLIAQVSNSGANSSTTAVGAYTLSSGAVTSTSNLLPGGSYNVTAHYAGDGIFGASDSNAIPVTVNPESSLTTFRLFTYDLSGNLISSNAPGAVYGSPYVIRVDVTNNGGTACSSAVTGLIVYPCPTGPVTVKDNGVVLPASYEEGAPPGYTPGVYNLNAQGYLEDFYIQFPVGSHPLAASYAGDSGYNTSTSATDTLTFTQASTGTGVSAPTTATTGTNVTLTATVATQSLGFGPSGTVTFLNNGSAIGSPVAVTGTAFSYATGTFASATASLITSFSSSGTESITATYSGDANYVTSTSSAATITVSTAPDFSFSANPTSGGTMTVTAGGSATSTLTIAPANGFTGAVTFTCTGAPPGATCSAPSANVTSTSSVTSTLSITTTASNPPLAPEQRVPPSFRLQVGLPWLWVGLLALAMLISLGTSRRRRAWLVLAPALLVVGIWAACGGGSNNGGGNTAPAVSLSPASLTFAAQGVGTTSTAKAVTLSNTGNAALSITGVALSGTNPGDFVQTNTCGSSVAAGANCAINVTFTPSATGTRTAAVGITDNATGSPQTISLSGTGATSTAKGTYPLTVTATSGSTVHPVTVTLTVN